jgi:hypothetical protein
MRRPERGPTPGGGPGAGSERVDTAGSRRAYQTVGTGPVNLFGEEPVPAFRHDSATSRSAAEVIEPKAGTLRAQALELLRDPLTDDQGAERLGVSGNTWRPRRVELVKAGLVVRVGTGRSAGGHPAAIWQATAHARRDHGEAPAGDLWPAVVRARPTWMGKRQLERLVREAVEAKKGNTGAALRQVLADLEVLR